MYLHIYLSLSKKLIFNDRYRLSPTLPTTLCRLVISHRPEPCARQAPSRSIKFYFNLLNLLNRLMVASEKSCPRPPTPPAAWIHQIHTAGGASGSTTMVMVFVCCLCFLSVVCAFCAVSSGRRYSPYVDEYERDVDKFERITLR